MQEASALYDDFADFIKTSAQPEDGELLQGFLLEWLEHGDAVVESGGNFGTYLKGVVLIIARWLDNRSMLDFQGSFEKPPRTRRATGVLDLNEGALCLDRDYFRTILMRRLVQRD
jgi:hypothetical protein